MLNFLYDVETMFVNIAIKVSAQNLLLSNNHKCQFNEKDNHAPNLAYKMKVNALLKLEAKA